MERLPDIAKELWFARHAGIQRNSKVLNGKLEEVRRLNSAAIKAKLTGGLSCEDFDSLKATNTKDENGIRQQLTALESERLMMQELIEQSEHDLVDLVGAWWKAGVNGRKELRYFVSGRFGMASPKMGFKP